MEKHVNKFVAVWALALTAFLVMGLTIPNSFTSGTTISSAEMNANFAAVKTAVDALETSPGRIVAMARINGAGTLQSSWQANGMTPTVMHTAASGLYDIDFPGVPVTGNAANRCVQANLISTGNGYATVSGFAATSDCRIRTYDAAGTETDFTLGFWVIVTNVVP